MADEMLTRTRYGEACWRAHHEAWRCSELNQREYCEAQGIPLKAFGNWRTKFKAEPQLPERKLLYRRGGLSHTLSHSLSHPLSHVTYPSSWLKGPVVPPAAGAPRWADCGSIRATIGLGVDPIRRPPSTSSTAPTAKRSAPPLTLNDSKAPAPKDN